MIFKIGTTEAGDYSDRVIAGSYNVQTKPVYKSWTDANETEHRLPLRTRTEGTFDMFFRNISDYNVFTALVESTKASDLTVLCTVLNNNLNSTVSSNFYIDYAPVRDIKGNWEDYMQRFTVTIREA